MVNYNNINWIEYLSKNFCEIRNPRVELVVDTTYCEENDGFGVLDGIKVYGNTYGYCEEEGAEIVTSLIQNVSISADGSVMFCKTKSPEFGFYVFRNKMQSRKDKENWDMLVVLGKELDKNFGGVEFKYTRDNGSSHYNFEAKETLKEYKKALFIL